MAEDFAGGAAAARNKLSRFLREHGICVRSSRGGCPPSDEDFLDALKGAELHPPEEDQVLVAFGPRNKRYKLFVSRALLDLIAEERDHRYLLLTVGRYRRYFLAQSPEGQPAVYQADVQYTGDVCVSEADFTMVTPMPGELAQIIDSFDVL
jgi:hypothetical protein